MSQNLIMLTEEIALGIVLMLLGVPITVLLIECLWATQTNSRTEKGNGIDANVAVLIPAHNEAVGIGATLKTILPQVANPKSVTVVADNCEDETAQIAREYGVTVLERKDRERRGKGYALDFGLQFLAQEPPDVVVMVDADCDVKPSAIAKISRMAALQQRPVQALYLLEQPENSSVGNGISALAFLVKNFVRPLGLKQLGLPCLLTGAGMAFPWQQLAAVSLAGNNLVEDMQLGLDLAITGYSPLFCETAVVMGRLPQQQAAIKSQRTRWEHGHLQTLLNQVPRLFKEGIQQRRFELIALALEISVPPLSLLALLWLATAAIATVIGIAFSVWLPVLLLALLGVLMAMAILLSWAKFGQPLLSKRQILLIPGYILWKIPIYLGFVHKRQQEWVRTERDINVTES